MVIFIMLLAESGSVNLHPEHTECLEEHDIECDICTTNEPTMLNASVTYDEILYVINTMRNNKAPGPDGLIIEMFKSSKNLMIPKLLSLFNSILLSGVFPETWGNAIIHTLHKGGDVNIPGNYRGISLLSVTSKIFTKILNERLIKWAESANVYYEEQAGFRKGYSTVDQIFNLFVMGEKYLSKRRGRMYVSFIDFSRAFDQIPHISLFVQLIKRGIHGCILQVLRSMYSKLKASVRTNSGLTEWFECIVGTRQGCMLSPFLFAMYVNEFDLLRLEGCRGIQISAEQFPGVNVLMYADDMVLCSDTVGDLQKQLCVLEMYCRMWGMTVNLTKSRIVVFRKGGTLRDNEVVLQQPTNGSSVKLQISRGYV